MEAIKPNNHNYFSKELDLEYYSNSQIKNFIGTRLSPGCEERALAILKGEFSPDWSIDMLIGSFVDAHFEGSLDEFKTNNPDIFTQKGELKAQFKHALKIIEVAEKDELFMQFMNGEKQVVLTGEIFGKKFKGKLDVRHEECIVDLKVMKDMNPVWSPIQREKVNFVYAWRYTDQLAIYQELEFQTTGIRKPCYLAVLTKEKYPNKEIIEIPQKLLDDSMHHIEFYIEKIDMIKTGELKPKRCGICDYCLKTKKLFKVRTYDSLNDF